MLCPVSTVQTPMYSDPPAPQIGQIILQMFLALTRPSVNYAKDWLDHSFLFPGLVWSEKEFYFGYDH